MVKKSFREWRTDAMFKLKVFTWYIFTEPFRELVEVGKGLKKIISLLNKTITWAYISAGLMVVGVIKGKPLISGLLALILLVSLLAFEFERGFWMNRYRQKLKRKIKKGLEDSGERAHLDDIKKGIIKGGNE